MNALKLMALFSIVMALLMISCASHMDQRPDFGDADIFEYRKDREPVPPCEPDMDELFEDLHEWNRERPNRGGRSSR